MNYQRFISFTHMLLIAVAVVFAGYCCWLFLQQRMEYTRQLQDENKIRAMLTEEQQKLRDNQRILERLRTDPVFVDMAIRRRLGYAKPGELIFRFEQTDDTQRPSPALPDR